jgi:hypothetical protein
MRNQAQRTAQRRVQAIIFAIDQYAEKALSNRDYFLNKPYGAGRRRPQREHQSG